MEYVCLRDCFVHNRYHFKGKTYNLPPGEDAKNFKPVIPVEEALKPPTDTGSAELTDITQAEVPQTETSKTEAKPKRKKTTKKKA